MDNFNTMKDSVEATINEITELTKQWYKLIGSDHHKNRDCFWYINTIWAYGDKPCYAVEHNGYVYDDVRKECKTYEEALLTLKKEIENAIKEKLTFAEQYD